MSWIKNKMMMLALALSKVEKNALSQSGENLSDDVNCVREHKMGMLSYDLNIY